MMLLLLCPGNERQLKIDIELRCERALALALHRIAKFLSHFIRSQRFQTNSSIKLKQNTNKHKTYIINTNTQYCYTLLFIGCKRYGIIGCASAAVYESQNRWPNWEWQILENLFVCLFCQNCILSR